MKFTPLTFAAVLAVLFAAIILTHVFAPGAIALVASLASAAFAAVMQFAKASKSEDEKKDDDEPKDPPAGGGPNLTLISGGLSAFLLVFACACGDKPPAKDPTQAALDKCNTAARADDYVGHLPLDEIMRRWDECMQREHDKESR